MQCILCSECAGGGEWRQIDHQPPSCCLPAGVQHKSAINLNFGYFSVVSGRVFRVTEPHTDAARDSLRCDIQEEEKEEEGAVHTHTSPSILCSWDWLPAKPTVRVSNPRTTKALWAATILTASAKADLMASVLASEGPSSAGSLQCNGR